MATTTPVVDRTLPQRRAGGGGRIPFRGDGGGDDGREGGGSFDTHRFGLWMFLGSLAMLFTGFTSAYLVRKASADWAPLSPPGVLWLGGAALLASSAALEVARRRLRGWSLPGAQLWLAVTGILGLLFLGGQLAGWRGLTAQGLGLASNPHSSFFYVLSGLHALHLVSALIWFAVAYWRLRAMRYTPGSDGLRLFATYWHFLAVLWVYLFVLIFLV